MEMENHEHSDDMPKRSRFYQGIMDTPILKSGKKTRYRQLPSTIIIFITQDDIFKRDLAKYTFTEQCEEIRGLHLDDGTTKIFLNMTSKNGSQELISLLQYMKKTTLDNPEVRVKDKRLRRLDRIVQEVKESEEWEAVQMNILEIGIEKGKEEGKKEGLEEGLKKGKKEGRKEGENALITLYTSLKRIGREEDADRAMTDPETRKRLYREMGINDENPESGKE
jgi:predicted transposase/invertase (TIGR01784 family)